MLLPASAFRCDAIRRSLHLRALSSAWCSQATACGSAKSIGRGFSAWLQHVSNLISVIDHCLPSHQQRNNTCATFGHPASSLLHAVHNLGFEAAVSRLFVWLTLSSTIRLTVPISRYTNKHRHTLPIPGQVLRDCPRNGKHPVLLLRRYVHPSLSRSLLTISRATKRWPL